MKIQTRIGLSFFFCGGMAFGAIVGLVLILAGAATWVTLVCTLVNMYFCRENWKLGQAQVTALVTAVSKVSTERSPPMSG